MPDARGRHGIAAFSRAGSFQANADPATPRRARHIGNNKHPKGQRELEPWHVAGSTLATQLRRQRHLQSNTQRERPTTVRVSQAAGLPGRVPREQVSYTEGSDGRASKDMQGDQSSSHRRSSDASCRFLTWEAR
jgi:hypothetical protein